MAVPVQLKHKMQSLLDLGYVKYVSPFAGIIFPGLGNAVRFPKFTMAFYKWFPLYSLLIVFSFSLLNYVSLLFNPLHSTELSVYYFVVGTNALVCVFRIVITLNFRQDLQKLAGQLNRNFSNPMQSKMREMNVKEKMNLVNGFFLIDTVSQATMAVVFELFFVICKKTELHPSILPGDRNDPGILWSIAFYGLATEVGYLLTQTSYQWALMFVLRLTSVEFQVIGQQISAIFRSLRHDENNGTQIRQKLSMNLLNNMTINEDSEWMDVRDDPIYYKEKLKLLNDALDQCVAHHSAMIKTSRRIRKVYGSTIICSYVFAAVMSTSWIVMSQSGKDEGTFWLPPFAMMAIITTFTFSFCGEENITAGCSIASDALGMDWYLFPIDMQKKLLMILKMSQRPLYVDAFGQGPLCMQTFDSVIKFCFSLFSLLSSK